MSAEKESILDRKTVIVSETDARGVILYANDDFCRISGYSKAELIGKPHNIVRHPDMPKEAFSSLWETIKSGNVWNGIVKNRTKSGDYYWVNATVYPSRTPTGETRYFSVRVKPTDAEIEEAQNTYASM